MLANCHLQRNPYGEKPRGDCRTAPATQSLLITTVLCHSCPVYNSRKIQTLGFFMSPQQGRLLVPYFGCIVIFFYPIMLAYHPQIQELCVYTYVCLTKSMSLKSLIKKHIYKDKTSLQCLIFSFCLGGKVAKFLLKKNPTYGRHRIS